MHLTVAFLGETDEDELKEIQNKLKKIKFIPFTLKTDCFGFFPHNTRIRIVWLGIKMNQEFMQLQKQIRDLFGFKEKLMPHITIARAHQIITDKNEEQRKRFSNVKYEEVEFQVNKFFLYESVPGPNGHRYRMIEEYSN
jgi:RNA 2',3'-cyclic 3'-phosphodiesterase